MKRLLYIFIFLNSVSGVSGQGNRQAAIPLSPYDSVLLSSLPEMAMPAFLKSTDLPYKLDNSKLPYFREIYEQLSSECSQVSAIAYNFTYEMCRLRDVSAGDPENQFPTHFTYNFMNGGNGWHGVSYFHSFEILRTLGCPTVATYGGMAAGGDSRWMSGYDNYFSAMRYRINSAYQIKVGTAEGLSVLKHWLHNHLEGAVVGGVASFYANAPWNTQLLPGGTPEGGKHVIVRWGGIPAHAMTIVGYNDSIRYDYNQDGKYTNHLDINSDGTVDMRDWEIGGLLFADGWGGGIDFGDSGRCYMMYKTLAEKCWTGGIWNNAVHVLDVKEPSTPKVTAKITITHNNRSLLRVRCGVSDNPSGSIPQYCMSFPVFNYQGGNHYMQGGTSDEEKTIEFGLDISPLTGHIGPDGNTRFFLVIDERDTNNLGQGMVTGFSVTDHTGPVKEFGFSDSAIMINDNATTYIPINFLPPINNLSVSSRYMPPAVVGENYSFQLQSEGGTPPYCWHLLPAYEEEESIATVNSGGVFLTPGDWLYGNIMYPLPFSFPFYGSNYDTIYIHPDGFVMFDDTQNPWPYLYDEQLFIRKNKCIAPFATQLLSIDTALAQGIWVKENPSGISIRWVAGIHDNFYSPVITFELILEPGGEIRFIYGDKIEAQRIHSSCGISNGDDLSYHFPLLEDRMIIEETSAVSFRPAPVPDGLVLNEQGLYTGIPTTYYDEIGLHFCVEDANKLKAFKTLKFSSTDLDVAEYPGPTDNFYVAYPNPFRNKLHIKILAGGEMPVSCKIYSGTGRLVKTLAERKYRAGGDVMIWDGSDDSGQTCKAGMYIIQLQYGDNIRARKIILSP